MGLFHEAAGCVSGAAGLRVAHVLVGSGSTGKGRAELVLPGRYLLQPRQAQVAGLVAGLRGHVALVASGAAVLMIVTAHGLKDNTSPIRLKSGLNETDKPLNDIR